ncbi:LuxR family transcriptional regulator [Xanthomonas campestris pv. plantaginis]|uniref:LuxR family transcriptional regulator n=1 Tax=Xanthomonas campestris TaxID=339 RepID=UPI002B23115E|nr:LuxR family transcriptional regulator [Xanthomonas campestris]MEA9606013.1 LuxR family transcriptional regulator [Xanthomonas campestris pv. plantaginis]
MVDMKTDPTIVTWEGCDPTVSEAIEQFKDRWRPYSASSRRYPIVGLIQELIDPAVAAYTATMPQRYLGHIPGAGTGVSFSGIIRLVGLDAMVLLQRELLRKFIRQEDCTSARDKRFTATLESLFELIWACARKQPVESPLLGSDGKARGLNGRRRQGFCRFCGALTELASFAGDESQLRGAADSLRLSSLYCVAHQPKLLNGAANPAYRQVKRSIAQFDLELARLTRQCAKRSRPHAAASGDKLVDGYFFHYMLSQTLQPADLTELRNLARLMVDSKLSDTKKKILLLQYSGLNQSEIAEQLSSNDQRPLTRQAVSKTLKALASIPATFHLKKR